MSTTFWYHPESDSFVTLSGGGKIDPLLIQIDEQEWIDKQIERVRSDKILPDGCNAVLVEARKTRYFHCNGIEVLTGIIYGHKYCPDGTQIESTAIKEVLPGNIIRTRNSTYLVQWAKKDTKNG